MKLDVGAVPEAVRRTNAIEVGDVFQKRGGKPGFWVVVSITESGLMYLMSFNTAGEVTGCQGYYSHYFERNMDRKVGRATNIPDNISVDWFFE